MRELIVDGYNIIHAWPDLAPVLRRGHAEDARRLLIGALAEYAAGSDERVTVVFDAHARDTRATDHDSVDGVTVIFGSRAQSADHVIERRVSLAAQHGGAGLIVVVTDDRLQRAMVMAMGAAVLGAAALREQVVAARAATGMHREARHRAAVQGNRLEHGLDERTRAQLERMRRGQPQSLEDGPGDEPTA